MDTQTVHSSSMSVQINSDDICPLQKCSFRTLAKEWQHTNLQIPYIITLTKDHFGNLFFYDTYSLHSHFSILLNCCAKIHYFVCKNYNEWSLLSDATNIVQNYLLSSPLKKQQENELTLQMRSISITDASTCGQNSVPKSSYYAKIFFEKALQKNASDCIAHAELGTIYLKGDSSVSKNGKLAAWHLQKALSINPNCFSAIKTMALLLLEYQGDVANAKELLEKAHAINQSDIEVSIQLAKYYQRKCPNEQKKIEALCKRILVSNPKNAYATNYLRQNQPKPVNPYLPSNVDMHPLAIGNEPIPVNTDEIRKACLMGNPNDAFTMSLLGHCYRRGGLGLPKNMHQAEMLFERALTLDSKNVFVVGSLAIFLNQKEKATKEEKLRMLSLTDQAIQIDPKHPFVIYCQHTISPEPEHVQIFVRTNSSRQDSLDLIALDQNPNDALALMVKAEHALAKGSLQDQEIAKNLLEKVLKLDSKNTLARIALADLLLTSKYPSIKAPYRGYQLLLTGSKDQPKNSELLAILGDLLKRGAPNVAEDQTEAKKLLKQAVKIDKKNVLACTALAEMYQERYQDEKDLQKAKKLFEAALSVNPDHTRALTGLGELLIKQEQPSIRDHATTLLEKALQLNPRNSRAKYHLEFEYIKL